MKSILAILLLTTISGVYGMQWNCRNLEWEITCDIRACVASKGFTPMDIHVDDNGFLSVCLYSGCWKGQGEIVKSKYFLMVAAHGLPFSTSNKAEFKQDIAIVIDSRDNISVIKAGSYAMPVRCKLAADSIEEKLSLQGGKKQ